MVSTHPLAADVLAPSNNVLVYIGTGRYLAQADLTDSATQSIYAIWDNPADTSTIAKGSLLQQSITEESTNLVSSWRTTSTNSINWSTHRGWYLNLLSPNYVSGTPSERVIVSPRIVDATTDQEYRTAAGRKYWRVIFATSISEDDPCSSGGTSWIMELDLHSGARPQRAVLDYNGDGVISNRDYKGATDTNNDGIISNSEAAAGAVQSGTFLGDMVVGEISLLAYAPPDDGSTSDEDASKGKLYKQFGQITGSLKSLPNGGVGSSVTTSPRVFWRQIY